jgi:hypothetical protein
MGKINKKSAPIAKSIKVSTKKTVVPKVPKKEPTQSEELPDLIKESVTEFKDVSIKKLNVDSKKIKKNLKKREKQKLKKEEVLKKIELTKQSFKEEKDAKKRAKTAVVGDMKPLLDSLPSLDSLFTIKKSLHHQNAEKVQPTTKRKKKIFRIHAKTEQFLDRFDQFNKILNDPQFKKSPREMIAEKIRQRRLAEQAQLENME